MISVIVIGSVVSTGILIEKLVEYNIDIKCVFSLAVERKDRVSGYLDVSEISKKHNIKNQVFWKINDDENVRIIKDIKPDYIFICGLSQLVNEEIINSAKYGVIGNHPAPLPKFRGRAPIVWQMLLGKRKSKVSLFFIDKGIDSGDIIYQEKYFIGKNDYISDVIKKVDDAFKILLDKVIPKLISGKIRIKKQVDDKATYLLKRSPTDGYINWNTMSTKEIHGLIRSVSKPYPGAYSNYQGKHKITFWKADPKKNKKYIGMPGQIVSATSKYIEVLTKDGLIISNDFQIEDNVRIISGNKLL